MKGKNSHVFLLKKVGGALIRVGALNRDYTDFLCSQLFWYYSAQNEYDH